ncbi:hypothetical protein [Bdellovibrio sp. HCB337]|uniref:hypothetical protein n=1 Tax=Bdellovibrio sp. HCB337 TaxID=3394358 RepID=UPI0039A432D0
MKIANTLSVFLLALNFLVLSVDTAQASYDDYQRFRKGTYDFEIETQYFKSDANYLGAGDAFQTLPFNQSYEIFNTYLKARYDFGRRSSLYGHLNIANATSHGVDAGRTNSSLPDAQLGYAHLVYSEDFDVIADFNVIIPFYKTNVNTDTALNAENVIEATGLMRLQKAMDPTLLFAYLGATFRQSRSALVPWGLGLEFAYPQWALGGKIFGYQSVTDDPDTGNTIQRQILIDRVDAGSYKFYYVNPSLIDSEVYLRFKFNKTWTITGGLGTTITGANNAAGLHGGLSLMYTWDSEPSHYMRPDTESDLGSEKKVPKFKEETNDGINQNIFQKKGTAPPTPRPGTDMTPANETVAVKRVGPKPAPTPMPEATDGGEVQLKLKKKKKKRSS